MKNPKDVAAQVVTTDSLDSTAIPASSPAEHPSTGGSFLRQPDGSLQRNPAHAELKHQLVRRPQTPSV